MAASTKGRISLSIYLHYSTGAIGSVQFHIKNNYLMSKKTIDNFKVVATYFLIIATKWANIFSNVIIL